MSRLSKETLRKDAHQSSTDFSSDYYLEDNEFSIPMSIGPEQNIVSKAELAVV